LIRGFLEHYDIDRPADPFEIEVLHERAIVLRIEIEEVQLP
jgi:hypothetical protein